MPRWIAALVLFSSAACGGAPPPAPSSDPLASVAWIAGRWTGTGPDGSPAEEVWQPPSGGVMRGRGVNETLRIEVRDGALHYVALPEGAASETAFRAVIVEEGRVVFENGEHDFPQRIEYVREQGGLRATVSDLAGSNAASWHLAGPASP
jgi:hypothetical protein